MGGRMALYTALGADRSAGWSWKRLAGFADRAERADARGERRGAGRRASSATASQPFVDALGAPAALRLASPRCRTRRARRCAGERLSNTPLGLANSLRGVGTGAQPPLHDALPALATPTLLLAGELDEKFSRIAWQMAEQLPNAEARIVLDAGHIVHLEQPELDARVDAQLRQVEPCTWSRCPTSRLTAVARQPSMPLRRRRPP